MTTTPIDRAVLVKPIDAWWTVLFIDPIVVRIVPPLTRVRAITPTRVTLLAHALGVVSAVAFGFDLLVVGAVVFELRFLADCIDGKLARATRTSSALGRELDVNGDLLFVAVNFAALGYTWVDGSTARTVVVVWLVIGYLLSWHLHDTRQRLLREAGRGRTVEQLGGSGLGAALARRRLLPMPSSVEAEHGLLFVAAIAEAAGVPVLGTALIVVAAFYSFQVVRYAASSLRVAAAIDRDANTTSAGG